MTKPTALPIHDRAPEGQGIPRLRGHTLLCLQGFRGLGYSEDFVANLIALHRRLNEDPDRVVTVVDEPDAVCGACPHQTRAGCTLNGEDSETAMQQQDRAVLGRLGLRAGDRLSWRTILGRIASTVEGSDLPGICGSCRWLPLGYCREGIDRLRRDDVLITPLTAKSRGPA